MQRLSTLRLAVLCSFFELLMPGSGAAQVSTPPGISTNEAANTYVVEEGTRIPLTVILGTSTKTAQVGDSVYLQTSFPVISGDRIVIPAGSYVRGSVAEVRRAGRIKGRSEIRFRFDSLTLPNGLTRSFAASVSGVEGADKGSLDQEGTIQGNGNIMSDLGTVAGTTVGGAGVGATVGAVSGSGGADQTAANQTAANQTAQDIATGVRRGARTGLALGALGGLGVGLGAVLLTRGPDVGLSQGDSLEMVFDRPMIFEETEVGFFPIIPGSGQSASGSPPRPALIPANPNQ